MVTEAENEERERPSETMGEAVNELSTARVSFQTQVFQIRRRG